MTNEMIAVQANIDMTKELLKTEKNRLIAKLEDIVNKFIVNPHGAMITQKDIRIGLWSETEIHFNIGFYNEAEKRVDFASDAWFEYNINKNELLVNYGTIGNYTKSNIYQVKRVKMVADIFEKIHEIEAHLGMLAAEADAGQWRTLTSQLYEYEEQLSQFKTEQRTQQIAEAEYELKEGDVVYYNSDVRIGNKLFPANDSFKATVIRICEKTVKVKDRNGRTYQVPKDKFCAQIVDALLIVESED